MFVFPALGRVVPLPIPFSPPFFRCPFVYISFQLSVFVRSPHILATVQFHSVFQFIFFSGGLRDQWAAPVRVSAMIYDYFFESVYACVMQNTTWTFVGSASGQLVTYHHIFR